jgi:hypothetical protein
VDERSRAHSFSGNGPPRDTRDRLEIVSESFRPQHDQMIECQKLPPEKIRVLKAS